MTNITGIIDTILLLEKKLLLDENRTNSNFIKEIISIDFVEYGSSGIKYKYCLGDTYPPLLGKVKIIENSIETKKLSEEIVLVLYQTINIETNKITNRSSIWKIEANNTWKIIFHQGTKIE